MTKVSVVIAHYNTEEFTTECLRSLEKVDQSNLLISVIVVDNGSTKTFSFESQKIKVTILRNETNTGFTGGNNKGIQYALDHENPEYVLLLNSDTLVDPKFIFHLVEFAKTHDQMGSVSPKVYFQKNFEFHKGYKEHEKGKVIWFAGGSIDWKNVIAFHRGVDEVDHGQFDLPEIKRGQNQIPYHGPQTMDFATGCCVLFPTKVLNEIGLFDESYFAYWEDVDLSVRISKAGYLHYFCPDAIVWHKNAGSTGGSGSAFQVKLQKKNRLKFALKYASWRPKLALLRQMFSAYTT